MCLSESQTGQNSRHPGGCLTAVYPFQIPSKDQRTPATGDGEPGTYPLSGSSERRTVKGQDSPQENVIPHHTGRSHKEITLCFIQTTYQKFLNCSEKRDKMQSKFSGNVAEYSLQHFEESISRAQCRVGYD